MKRPSRTAPLRPSGMSPRPKGRRGSGRGSLPPPLSAASVEAIGRFVRILARCGARAPDVVRAVRGAAAEIPGSWSARAARATREMEYAPHTLTLWHTEAEYLDPLGKPRPLPFKGPSRSFAALVRRVDPRFDPREVLDYLVRGGAIRRLGRRYIPRARALFVRGAGGPDFFHTQRLLTNMLTTLEHNLEVKPPAPGWFVYVTENRQFPVRERQSLDKYVAMLGKEFLFRLDAYMHRREMRRRPGEPTLGVGIGVNLWEEAAGTTREGRARRRSKAVRAQRKTRRRRSP